MSTITEGRLNIRKADIIEWYETSVISAVATLGHSVLWTLDERRALIDDFSGRLLPIGTLAATIISMFGEGPQRSIVASRPRYELSLSTRSA